MRDVAEDGLEGEDDVHPLVPRVTDLVTILGPAAMVNHDLFNTVLEGVFNK